MKKIDFNTDWYVCRNNDGTEQLSREVDLPDDAMLYEQRNKNSKTGSAGAYFPGGKYIYKKSFYIPKKWQDKLMILEFEGIYRHSKVYINGQLAGGWSYGYTGFDITLNKYLVYDKDNEIKVIVDNSAQPNSRWYTGSGIYRPVNLYLYNRSHIIKDSLRINTPDLHSVFVKLKTQNAKGMLLTVKILDNAKVVTEQTAAANAIMDFEFQISDAKTWSAEEPYLYTMELVLSNGNGKVIDSLKEKFGIRTIEVTPEGLFINGQKTLLRGGCIHHTSGILGAKTFSSVEEYRVKKMKDIGFNAIRSAHNPMSKALLKACDRYGMYVMDEGFDQWLYHKNSADNGGKFFKFNWRKNLEKMIIKDYNHPSVIMYSIGNEISEIGRPEGIKQCRKMCSFIKSKDTTRLTTSGVNLALVLMAANSSYQKVASANPNDNPPTSTTFNNLTNHLGDMMESITALRKVDKLISPAMSYLDVAGYNYGTPRYSLDSKLHPTRVIVGSETFPSHLYKNWQAVKKYSTVIGDFMWVAWDYLGESGVGTIRYSSEEKKGNLIISAGSGIIDIIGKEHPEVQWIRMVWGIDSKLTLAVEPVIYANDKKISSMWRPSDGVESWSWRGCKNFKTNVIVYSTAYKVELVVNGKSYGFRKIKEFIAKFRNVIYQDGVIKAIEYDKSGNILQTKTLRTAGQDNHISLSLTKSKLRSNGEDIALVKIALTDKDGIVKSSEDREVRVQVSGAGELINLGSARSYQDEDFISDSHRTFYGYALAAIRSSRHPGKITIHVSAKNYPTETICLSSSEK